ncbi:MAG: IclR family transcriptional regulator [Sciscionella sp.]
MAASATGKGTTVLVQSVDRAISVLELLAKYGEAGVTEIAVELGVHKSTVSRLIGVLAARGLVEQLGERGKYVIGFGIVRLAGAAAGKMDLAHLGTPICEQMAESLGETVNIAVLDGDSAINISQARGTAAIAAQNWTGRRTPLHATSSGKILLSSMPEEELERIIAGPLTEFTPLTVTEAAPLRSELERITRLGSATCFEEYEVGLHAVAVPVHGPDHRVVAALSASGPSYRLSRSRARQVVEELRSAAEELSTQLSYVGR